MHGSVVNVPVNVSETCKHLPLEGNCEEVIFVKLKRKLSFKVFNQGLLIFSQTFASNSDYIFFAHSVLRQKKLKGRLTAGMFANYDKSVKWFVSNDQGFFIYESDKRNPFILEKILERNFGNGKIIRSPNLFFNIILC